MTTDALATTTTGSGRDKLLAAAIRLFAAKGYAAASVRDILRSAGVTAPVLYYHFGSKEGLFLAIAQEGRAKFEAARAEALRPGGSAAARILRLAHAHLAVRREYADLAWVVEQILSGPPEAAPPYDFRGAVRESVHRFEALVEEGIANGEFRPCAPRHVALAVMGALEVAFRARIYDERDDGDPDDVLESVLAVLLAGLADAPGAVRLPLPIT
jgi:TetR/AcrR family transcriptional regulator